MRSQMSARELLFEIQKQQFHHDETFHREIARLPLGRRLTHMALHISKYLSRIVSEHLDGASANTAWLDSFIISTSIANMLNRRLADLWDIDHDLTEQNLRQWLADKIEAQRPILIEFADVNDRLSSACEKFDHIEDYRFRPTIIECAGRLSAISAHSVYVRNSDLFGPVTERLLETKKKNIFFEG